MTQDQLVEVLRKKAPAVPASLYEAKDFADAIRVLYNSFVNK